MAFDPKKDYTTAIAKEKDLVKRTELERQKAEKVASMAQRGFDYRNPTDVKVYNISEAAKPVVTQVPKSAIVNTPQRAEEVSAPSPAQTTPQTQVPTPPTQPQALVTYRDPYGNLHTFFKYQEGEAPKDWVKMYDGEPPVQGIVTNATTPAIDEATRIQELLKAQQAQQAAEQAKLREERYSTLSKTLEGQKTGYEDLLSKLSEAQRTSLIASLQSKKIAGTTALEQEAKKVPLEGSRQKAEVQTSTMLKAKQLAEAMAAMGLSQSGAAERVQRELAALQQTTLAGLSQKEMEQLANIEQRKTGVEQEYQSGLATGEAAITQAINQEKLNLQKDYDAKMLDLQSRNFDSIESYMAAKQQIDRENTDKVESLKLKEQEYQRQLAEKRAAEEKLAAEKALSEEKDLFVSTISQYAKDYTQAINDLVAKGVPETDYRIQLLKAARTEKVMGQEKSKAEQAQKQAELQAEYEQQLFENAMKLWQESGTATAQIASALGAYGVKAGDRTSDAKFKELDYKLAQQASARAAAKASTPSSGAKMTTNQAITQARLILGTNASSADIQNMAYALQYGGDISGYQRTGTTTTKPLVSTGTIKAQIDADVKNSPAIDKRQATAQEIIKRYKNGSITETQADELKATYNFSDADIKNANNALEIYESLKNK